MTISEITGRTSFGNIIQIAGLLVVISGAFFLVRSQSEANASDISMMRADADVADTKTTAQISSLAIRMRGFEVREASAIERQSTLKRDMARIESDVKDLKRGQQQIMILLQRSLNQGVIE